MHDEGVTLNTQDNHEVWFNERSSSLQTEYITWSAATTAKTMFLCCFFFRIVGEFLSCPHQNKDRKQTVGGKKKQHKLRLQIFVTVAFKIFARQVSTSLQAVEILYNTIKTNGNEVAKKIYLCKCLQFCFSLFRGFKTSERVG